MVSEMVETQNINNRRIVEAKTYLLLRAAQRAYQGQTPITTAGQFIGRLERELQGKHIRYQAQIAPNLPAGTDAPQSWSAEFVCFGTHLLGVAGGNLPQQKAKQQLREELQDRGMSIGVLVKCQPDRLVIDVIEVTSRRI